VLGSAPISGDKHQPHPNPERPGPVSAANNYNYLLPSFTARLNLTDELSLDGGSRTLTRHLQTSAWRKLHYTSADQFFVNGTGTPI